jgi:hypothetical protein
MSTKNKKKLNDTKRDFLLTFFTKDEYTELPLNGFWLVKSFDGGFNQRWQVSIYSQETFKVYKEFNEARAEERKQVKFFDDIKT